MSEIVSDSKFNEVMLAQAAKWYARLNAGDVAESDKQEYHAWLDRDSTYIQAYEHVCQIWQRTSVAKE